MNGSDISTLAQIIGGYRKNELSFTIDENHVQRWLSQFSDKYQDIILKETAFILEKWYFNKSHFEDFYDDILRYLKKKMICSKQEVIKRVCFVSLQRKGESQLRMLQHFADIIRERYGIEIITTLDLETTEFVYIDDGLYTGSKARKDLKEVISNLPKGANLDVFYLVAGMQGLNYTQKQLKVFADEKDINVQLFRKHPLEDVKRAEIKVNNGNEIECYPSKHSCLWPLPIVEKSDKVKSYIDNYLRPHLSSDWYLFRSEYWKNDPGIFSSVENRNIVETEFLKKGIEIASYSKDKGIYPLGFNSWPSLGFGSFCASYMNISNTCPLVLWWGNVEKDGSVLDAWYPLLPRRVNSNEGYDFIDNMDDVIDDIYFDDKPYSMCPDCGKYFGIQEDGGNGFCIDCAWKH